MSTNETAYISCFLAPSSLLVLDRLLGMLVIFVACLELKLCHVKRNICPTETRIPGSGSRKFGDGGQKHEI